VETALRFEIPIIEALKEHEGNEKGEDEVEDSGGLMLETMIEGPMSDQGMKQIVFDLPAPMSDAPEQKRADQRGGECRHPPPVVNLGLFGPLVVLAVPFRHGFLRMENPKRSLNPFSCCKAFCVPGPDLRSLFFPTRRFHQREDTLGILKQHPLFPLEYGDHVFVMFQTEVVKGGFRIQGIGQDHIKESSITEDHPFQESLGRNDLSLPGLNHLHIQSDRYRESH